jgi:tetrahydromethanopterin S-methyltransferase subunit E
LFNNKRKGNITPLSSITLWVIPTLAYLVQKLIGVPFNQQYEFVWGIFIPSMMVLWFIMNFKITK